MKKTVVFILILLLISGIAYPALDISAAYKIDQDSCTSYVTMDFDSLNTLYSYNEHEKIYPASTTKLMTALVAIENCALDKVFVATENSTRFLEEGSGDLELKPGETMDFYSLLHALLIRSYNDVANIIAENVAGSEERFIEMMNEKAIELGAYDTHFTAPHGLHDDDHYTTAYDLALITKAAFSNFTISTICNKREYELPATNMTESFKTLKNTNLILGTNPGYSFIVTGGKTGFTSKAGNVLAVVASDSAGREVISVITGAKEREDAAELSLVLLDRSFTGYAITPIVTAGQIIDNHESIRIANAMLIEYLVPTDPDMWKLEKDITFKDTIDFSKISIGDVLGSCSYSFNGNFIGKSLIVAADSSPLIFASNENNDIISYSSNDLLNLNTIDNLPVIDTSGHLRNEFLISFSISFMLLLLTILVFVAVVKIKRKNTLAKKSIDSVKK